MLNLRLDITGEKNEGRFPLDGLQLELFQDKANDDHPRPVMSGANSKHAALSTGIRKLHVMNEASFIGMNGMQHAHLENGCWEITWRDGDPSGALVCGFDVPKEVRVHCMNWTTYLFPNRMSSLTIFVAYDILYCL